MTIKQNHFIACQAISRKQMDQMGMPIGNPHKPLFKQKEMPFIVSAVTAASVSIGAASAAIAAGGVMASMGAIGTAALATVSAIGTIAAVAGTAMSVVGMVTGDKGLMKLGAIVGLAGGVASLASGAVASLAAGGEFAMGTAGIQSANAANAAAANVGNIAANGIATGATISTATGQAASNAANLTANMSPVVNSAGTTANQAINSLVGGTQAGGVAAASPLIGNTGGTVLSSSQALGIGNAGNLATTGSSGFFGKLIADMTPKDYLVMGGSVVSGGMQAVKENQANAAQQQAYEYKQAQRNTQLKNMNTPLTLSPSNTLQVGNYTKNPDLIVKV
jgi:hypothetical protein